MPASRKRRTASKVGARRKPRASASTRTNARASTRPKPHTSAAIKPKFALERKAPARTSGSRAKAPAPRAALAPVPPAFAAQRAGAGAREELLFELHRARASVKAATQGLSAGTAERPLSPGKWSIKEIVLHLSERDRVRLEEFGRTLAGQPHSWAGIEDPRMAATNEMHLVPLRAHTWDEAVRRMDSLREQLLWRLSQLPAEPDDVWQRGHAFGDMMWGLPEHDRHHAEQIKLARIGDLVPAED